MSTITSPKRTSLETRIEAAAERLLAMPEIPFSEIELTPSLRLVRASDVPEEAQHESSPHCLPYIYRSEWFFLVNTTELPIGY